MEDHRGTHKGFVCTLEMYNARGFNDEIYTEGDSVHSYFVVDAEGVDEVDTKLWTKTARATPSCMVRLFFTTLSAGSSVNYHVFGLLVNCKYTELQCKMAVEC